MKNNKNNSNFIALFVRIIFWISSSLMIMMIATFFYIVYSPYFYAKTLIEKSTMIICKIKEYKEVNKKLPDNLDQIISGSRWANELSYINRNTHDFTLSVSNGFDTIATYNSTKNTWNGPYQPLIFKHEPSKVDCPLIDK
jgi:hypothetical protein